MIGYSINLENYITQGEEYAYFFLKPYICSTLIKLIRILNTLNIDTALGAVSIVFIASFIRNVEVDLVVYGTLFISVLFIYNLDHLVDAFRLRDAISSFRHSFYQKHFKVLLVWQGFLFATVLWLLFQLPLQVVYAGILMTFFMGIYFMLIFKFTSKNYLLREVVVALGYTFAIVAVPFANYPLSFEPKFVWFAIVLFFIALTNLWVFAIYDTEVDKNQGHHSISRRISTQKLAMLANGIIYITICLLIAYAVYVSLVVGALLLIVEIVYFLLLKNQVYFKGNDLYRPIGEAVLILPGLVLLIQYAI